MTTDDDRERSTESLEEAGSRLPDEAVVMRGGRSRPDTLSKTALAHYDECGDFAISVRSRPGATADDLARVDPPMITYARLRETTVGALRAAGYNVIPDEPPPAHALIMLPRLPTDEDYEAVSTAFGEPRANPVYQKGAG